VEESLPVGTQRSHRPVSRLVGQRHDHEMRGHATTPARRSPRPALRTVLAEPRVLVGLALVIGGIVWALARGLHFYGLTPVNGLWDLDQPPMAILLVGYWTLYRSRPG
jgi:hypothetical protein